MSHNLGSAIIVAPMYIQCCYGNCTIDSLQHYGCSVQINTACCGNGL